MGLFDDQLAQSSTEHLDPGAVVLRQFLALHAAEVFTAVRDVAKVAPFRQMVTPGGFKMSAAMTNCGEAGWVTDKRGYRYSRIDPESGVAWPAMPDSIRGLATAAANQAGFDRFAPDVCLINRYEPGAKMSLHQDLDEKGFDDPIVSFSLGLPVKFLWGGKKRSDRPRRILLEHGDVVVWGGPTRLYFHGVDPLAEGDHPLTGRCRINLTFRRALT
ncbi:DNA oxidative demethylase AlkB [bacterium]|nr:DNA oxidative demethylase AlkB [bacterium]